MQLEQYLRGSQADVNQIGKILAVNVSDYLESSTWFIYRATSAFL